MVRLTIIDALYFTMSVDGSIGNVLVNVSHHGAFLFTDYFCGFTVRKLPVHE